MIRAEAKEALSLDPSIRVRTFCSRRLRLLTSPDWKQAAEHFAIALAGASVSAEAHWAYASLYFQPWGRFQESVAHMEGAVERNPLNAHWRGGPASHLTHAGLHDQAIQQANEALEIDESSLAASVTLGEAYIAIGRWAEAAEALEKAYRLQPQYALSTGMLAGALVRVGEHARAEQMIRELGDTPRPLIGRVLYHWCCEETDQAADWYERAINGRDPSRSSSRRVRRAAPSGHPRWPKLASMMKLPVSAI